MNISSFSKKKVQKKLKNLLKFLLTQAPKKNKTIFSNPQNPPKVKTFQPPNILNGQKSLVLTPKTDSK